MFLIMRRILEFLLVLCATSCACASSSEYDTDAIREAVRWQMTRYPESTLLDLYKAFFQDAYGPGHLLSDEPGAMDRMVGFLANECEYAREDASRCERYEKSGYHGNYYRVDLSVLNDDTVPFNDFAIALLESTRKAQLPDIEAWKREWNVIERQIRRMYPDLPGYRDDRAAIRSMLAEGSYASHHSRRYNEAYHPHYRLIERTIFENTILPRLGE